MSDDYKEWQNRYDSLNEEAWDNSRRDDADPEKWTKQQERNQAGNMRLAAEQERIGREEARDEWDEDANDGHDERIEKVKANEQLAANQLAHLDGEYEYATPMQDGDEDLHKKLEEENNRHWQDRYAQNDDKEEGEEHNNSEEGSGMDLVDEDSD
ncbi:hypothetical protein ONS95_011540 [Cadophora gregata]|uniref:uncharacterized protein n=1 Tax=Cadophora gregata TaxID=51156 RepID=UPI0026DD1EBD|nr:uncharacterized protein ONS95_011540 [Cadophora gregata]KAK0120132.1 hypothetical protein ONS95_011540 [Cadophora gregata]KAK0121161.1 hypothetical protein ONS96_011340 [Cadophora gregata f. sp. sojae]